MAVDATAELLSHFLPLLSFMGDNMMEIQRILCIEVLRYLKVCFGLFVL